MPETPDYMDALIADGGFFCNLPKANAFRFRGKGLTPEQRFVDRFSAKLRKLSMMAFRRGYECSENEVEEVDFRVIILTYGLVCHICTEAIDDGPGSRGRQLQFDHVIPLAQGGSHIAVNIRPAHAVCNLRKGCR